MYRVSDRTIVVDFSGELVPVAYVEHRDEDEVDEFYVYRNVYVSHLPTFRVSYKLDGVNELPYEFVEHMIYLRSFIDHIDWGTQLDVT